MNSPTEEVLKAFKNEVADFLSRIIENKEQLQNDLADIELPLPTGKICDFGCELGFTTYCLASILNATESVGADIDVSAINQAKKWFKAINLYIQFTSEKPLSDDIVYEKSNLLLGILKPPEFAICDVVSEENLPSDISLAYCRKLLVNIACGNYSDNIFDIDKVRLTIKNIAKKIVHGGWLIVVEETKGGNFSHLLEEQGLRRINVAQFSLNKIVPYTRYVYRKQF
jgi:hypothetical protein